MGSFQRILCLKKQGNVTYLVTDNNNQFKLN